MQKQNPLCFAAIGSMTQAMRAQKVLADAAVRTEIVGVDAQRSRRGCAYALSYPCSQERNVRTILGGASIRVRDFYGEEIQ